VIVLVLVLIWLVVLAPAITHKLASSNTFSSIIRFRAGTRLLQKILGHREDVIPVISGLRTSDDGSHRQQALRNAEIIRKRRERQRTVARRRRSVATLLVACVGALVIGVIPGLRAFWILAGVAALALFAYLALLAHFTRLEVNAAERRVKVVELPRTIFPVALDSAGRAQSSDRPVSYRVAYAITGNN